MDFNKEKRHFNKILRVFNFIFDLYNSSGCPFTEYLLLKNWKS